MCYFRWMADRQRSSPPEPDLSTSTPPSAERVPGDRLAPPPRRIPALDWTKGLAILGVILIHAKALDGTIFFEQVIQRSVPVFLVLFGITSEFWWQRHGGTSLRSLVAWYRERFSRLLLPVWTAATLWWVCAAALGHTAQYGWPHLLVSYVGYSPWIGVSWFVTLMLQLVVLFPLLRVATIKLGRDLSLIAAMTILLACGVHYWAIIAAGRDLLHNTAYEPGFFYFWIFAPRAFWPVVAGIVVARCGLPTKPSLLLLSLGAVVGVYAIDTVLLPPLVRPSLFFPVADVPFTLLLLSAASAFRFTPGLNNALGWLGRSSWGIYLAHTIVHSLVHFLGFAPEELGMEMRWAYAALLLASGSAMAAGGELVRIRFKAKTGLASPKWTGCS
jgi:peptidoglycan/LPS O-acetylase OafA/YrhL